ncbi:MAG TPA: universal stress protein [Thermoanaerobaculia bacterium]|jgi:nucleotide-binding universal stress UspA family protein|nr:universal stress protein [Thermoanaerobaculia bacterium]
MVKKIETVLIGTSLTEASDEVVRTGLKVARAAGARVVLAHAYSLQTAYGGAPFVPEVSMGEVMEAERLALRRRMTSQADRIGLKAGELAGMLLEPGPAHQMIMESARRKDVDLIVLGATETPLLSKLFGSTADRVVRKATCPVLVVRREMPVPPAKVLLPVDLSFLSAEAFREGLNVVAALSQDPSSTNLPEMEALYVVTELDRRLFATEEAPSQAEEHAREEMRRFLDRHAADSALKVAPRIETGYVEDGILLRIREWEPTLVVIGTHGRSGFERFLLGSVATRVIRDGGANVLVVPPEAARQSAEVVRKANEEVMVE